MADLINIGLFGIVVGVLVRTLWPYIRKVAEKQFDWIEFQKSFLATAIAGFTACAAFYLAIAPLTDAVLVELILTALLGVAGNEVFNELWRTIGPLLITKDDVA